MENRFLKSTGLRTEILTTITMLMGAALLLGGVMVLQQTEKSLLTERVGQLEATSSVLARALVQAGEIDQLSVNRLLSELPAKMHAEAWWLYDNRLALVGFDVKGGFEAFSVSRRQTVLMTGQLQKLVNFPPLLNFFDTSEPFVFFVLPLVSPEQNLCGVLEVRFSLVDIYVRIRELFQMILIYTFLYGLILVTAGYYLLHRNVICPARNLLRATLAVERGDLDTRLPEAGPVEIVHLAVAYNRMVDTLKVSRQETAAHIISLEEANRKLQQSRNELVQSEKLASVGQLAAGLAHELGNPLAAVTGYLEILKGSVGSASQQDIVVRSLAEISRIDFLVRELLDFSRPDDHLLVEDVDLAEELRAAVQLLQNQGLSVPQIRDNLPSFPLSVRMNRNRLQQVFVNILLNAVQACPADGQLILDGGTENEIWISIEDNGVGIAAADLDKIFEPFFSTKSPGAGTGLGLAICRRIIVDAGGSIEVESIPGTGSVFRLVFH